MKRFTATEKWEKPWFQDLPPHIKCLWQYMCDKCDCAGVWEMNWKAASLFIGKAVGANDLEYFKNKVGVFGGKLVIGSFVEFQYGKLSEDCRAHIPIFRTLAKHTQSIGYSKAIHSLQEKEEETEEETEQEPEQEPEPDMGSAEGGENGTHKHSGFDEFWQAYPRRIGKGNAEKAWEKHGCGSMLPQILTAVRKCKVSADWTKEAGQFIPHPATWLNRRGWEDEMGPRSGAISTIPGEHESILAGIKILPH